jgi:hypothetical protein
MHAPKWHYQKNAARARLKLLEIVHLISIFDLAIDYRDPSWFSTNVQVLLPFSFTS